MTKWVIQCPEHSIDAHGNTYDDTHSISQDLVGSSCPYTIGAVVRQTVQPSYSEHVRPLRKEKVRGQSGILKRLGPRNTDHSGPEHVRLQSQNQLEQLPIHRRQETLSKGVIRPRIEVFVCPLGKSWLLVVEEKGSVLDHRRLVCAWLEVETRMSDYGDIGPPAKMDDQARVCERQEERQDSPVPRRNTTLFGDCIGCIGCSSLRQGEIETKRF